MIKSYYRVLLNTLAVSLAYRWNVLAGIVTQLVQLLTAIFVWQHIYKGQSMVQGYSLEGMTTYLLLTSLLGVTFSSAHIFRLSSLVRKGTLSAFLVRPYSFSGDSLAVFIGSKTMEILITGTIAIALGLSGVIHFGSIAPMAALLVISNFLLLFLFGSVIGTLSFWLVQMWPMKPLYNSLMALLGGALFPLDLFPEGVRRVLELTPFSLFGFVNARVLQGGLSSDQILRYLLVSMGWSIVCFALYTFLWKLGLKRYEGVNA